MTTIILPDSSKLLLLLLLCLIQVKLLHGYRTAEQFQFRVLTHEQVTVGGLISLFWYEKGSCQTDENKTQWNDT